MSVPSPLGVMHRFTFSQASVVQSRPADIAFRVRRLITTAIQMEQVYRTPQCHLLRSSRGTPPTHIQWYLPLTQATVCPATSKQHTTLLTSSSESNRMLSSVDKHHLYICTCNIEAQLLMLIRKCPAVDKLGQKGLTVLAHAPLLLLFALPAACPQHHFVWFEQGLSRLPSWKS